MENLKWFVQNSEEEFQEAMKELDSFQITKLVDLLQERYINCLCNKEFFCLILIKCHNVLLRMKEPLSTQDRYFYLNHLIRDYKINSYLDENISLRKVIDHKTEYAFYQVSLFEVERKELQKKLMLLKQELKEHGKIYESIVGNSINNVLQYGKLVNKNIDALKDNEEEYLNWYQEKIKQKGKYFWKNNTEKREMIARTYLFEEYLKEYQIPTIESTSFSEPVNDLKEFLNLLEKRNKNQLSKEEKGHLIYLKLIHEGSLEERSIYDFDIIQKDIPFTKKK